jgi:acyl carrier protein
MRKERDHRVSADEVEAWIRTRIAQFINRDLTFVSPQATFESFGIDSAKAISLVTELEDSFGLPDELPLELMFEADSIRHASEAIAEAIAAMVDSDSSPAGMQ